MALRLGMNLGFVTNSSSVVHSFPVAVLNDPGVQAFLKAFEIHGGFVGMDLWHRAHCGTFAVTKDQKEEVNQQFAQMYEGEDAPYTGGRVPSVPTGDDQVSVIYGDEYQSMASSLSHLMAQAAEKLGIKSGYGDSYN
jgi:hypothetical protein